MLLYSYFRSTAAYRVRIALHLKQIEHTIAPINLMDSQQRSEAFLADNSQGLVPALKLSDGTVISQSAAILEWLEETYPHPALYSDNIIQRAQQRALCQHIACDIHPLNNLRVLRYLRNELKQGTESVDRWYAHWISQGFVAIEQAVRDFPGHFSLGQQPGMLEVLLIPQVFNARRFNVDIEAFPAIVSLDQRTSELPAFAEAHPNRQPDTPIDERA
ncbi:MAG: maleylacetoacetate isomerase [Congregibacter sp.]